MIQLKSTAAIESRKFNILVHGRPGTGKTMSVATAPSPLLLMAEMNGQDCLSPKNIEKVFGVNAPGISYSIPMLEVQTWEQVLEALAFMKNPANMEKIKTIFVDSVSRIAGLCLAYHLPKHKNPMQAYGALGKDVTNFIEAIMILPQDAVFLAHSGEIGGETRLMPTLEGKKLPRLLSHLFGETFFADVDFDSEGKRKYVVRTQQTDSESAKSRFGHLDDTEPARWDYIFHKLRAGVAAGITKPAAPATVPAEVKKAS